MKIGQSIFRSLTFELLRGSLGAVYFIVLWVTITAPKAYAISVPDSLMASLLMRQDRMGFADSATGGTAALRIVTSLKDHGPGTLREAACSDSALWIVFGVSGTIQLETPLYIKSNKTIDGRGADICVRRMGFRVVDSLAVVESAPRTVENRAVTNVIIANIRFDGCNDSLLAATEDSSKNNHDAITLGSTYTPGVDNIWIDHCTLRNYGDGLIDMVFVRRVTISWCRFEDHNKTMLINNYCNPKVVADLGNIPNVCNDVFKKANSNLSQYEGSRARVTLHHNYFIHTGQRNPLLLYGFVHAYNNVIESFGFYGMMAAMWGELRAENNIFMHSKLNRKAIGSRAAGCPPKGCPVGGYVQADGNIVVDTNFRPDSTMRIENNNFVEYRNNTPPLYDPDDSAYIDMCGRQASYWYKLDSANCFLYEKIKKTAGSY